METGNRTAACDVLTFTNNGQYLFATGDDKVVRTWRYSPRGLEPLREPIAADVPQPVLRWTSHRERRGNIYAAAVSPEPKGQYIAVGGLGIRNSQLAVLDRFSGEIKNAVPYLSLDPKQGSVSIWSIVFSPSGDQVACGTGGGSVWTWDWKTSKPPVLVGQHAGPVGLDYNYVRFVAYEGNRLLSADEHGGVYRWDLEKVNSAVASRIANYSNNDDPTMLIRFFALSPDGQELAAALEANRVEIRSLRSGGALRTIPFPPGHYPSALAYHPGGKKLAISLRVVDLRADFFKEIEHIVVVYDVGASPGEVARILPSYRIEALAFHPDGKHLATAGGNNHDVNVYDLDQPTRPLGTPMAGPGECIWGVGISADGRYVSYQTGRVRDPDHPNRRAEGPRKVFDLERRLFVKEDGIPWAPASRSTADGWQLKFSTQGIRRADQWFAQAAGGKIWPLPWELKINEFPRCYAFLPQQGSAHPTRVVVGHMYGASIYELTPEGPMRTRLLSGHDSEVTGMALSADGKRLITASRDQTIAGWSLEDWPSHPQLGAQLYLKGDRLWVGTIDQGGPIWETGLSTGDEVVLLVVEQKILYNRSGKYGADKGSAGLALSALQKPKAGVELYFGWKRPGETQVIEQLTNMRERPIWRFFPTRDGDWVLWRCQDYLYDTSTKGDSLIGWQRNMLDDKGAFNVKGTPLFYKAEQFRKTYHNPEKVSQTVLNWSRTAQGKSSFADIEPPKIYVDVEGLKGKDRFEVDAKAFKLTIKVVPNSARQNQELTRVVLWVNDFQLKKWENADLTGKITRNKNELGLEQGVFVSEAITIAPDMLRAGPNVIFAQSYNRADVRGESERILVTSVKPRPKAALHGLFIGVGDYNKSKPRQINLGAPQDADVLAEVWQRSRGTQYDKPAIRVLKDKDVSAQSVLGEFDSLAATVKPDDLLVFHLGGHGVSKRKLQEGVEANLSKQQLPAFHQQLPGLGQFLFLCGNFDYLRVRDTTISLDDLYEKLVKLPCHKVIMLDACNAAAADPTERKGTDIIRLFTKDGVGPIIFAACKAEESALEFPGFVVEPASGLFAQAIVKTIHDDFSRSKKTTLLPEDLFRGVATNVEVWVEQMRKEGADKDLSQHPQFFLPVLERNFAILVGKE